MSEILRGIITLVILAMVSVFVLSVIWDQRPLTEQLTTIFVFLALLLTAKLDAIMRRSQNNPLCMCMFFTILFAIELAGIIAVAVNDTSDTIVLKLWFQIDILIAVITFVAVLYHIILLCGGSRGKSGGGRQETASGDDYVAINVRNKRVPPPRRNAPRIVSGMPGSLRGVKIGAPRGADGLAF